MILGVPRENYPGERRVAIVPAVVPALTKAGLEVLVEVGAGLEAGYPDQDYIAKGAKLAVDRAEIFRTANIVVQVLCFGSNDLTGKADLPLMRNGQTIVGFLRPMGKTGGVTTTRKNRRHLLRRRVDAAHHSSAEHGRSLFNGHDLRI